MRARVDVSLTAAERMALWSRHAEANSSAVPDTNVWSRLLDWYLEGWAEANLAKIFAATAHGYRFDDPCVGTFSRWSFPVYFERLQEKFARAGAVAAQDVAFVIHGPMDGPRRRGRLTFFREAPRLGLAGISVITVVERGIIAESVAYDLNLALDVLRNPSGGWRSRP